MTPEQPNSAYGLVRLSDSLVVRPSEITHLYSIDMYWKTEIYFRNGESVKTTLSAKEIWKILTASGVRL